MRLVIQRVLQAEVQVNENTVGKINKGLLVFVGAGHEDSREVADKYLKKLRNNKNLSLRKVNKLTDISYTHLNMIENGKRNVTPALLRNLANLYNVDYLDLYEKAGYIELIKNEKLSNTANFRYANHNGINTEGLDDNDIEEINRFVEFIRNKKKNEGK